jgi:hypothetical protein
MESNPYFEARREWDERYADLVLGKRNWQIAASGLLLLSLILASGFVWLANHSRYLPYVVEVDKLGYALTVPQPVCGELLICVENQLFATRGRTQGDAVAVRRCVGRFSRRHACETRRGLGRRARPHAALESGRCHKE